MSKFDNRLQRTQVEHGDLLEFRFGNGLVVATDPLARPDPARVLPVSGPQEVILNRLLCLPEIVQHKRVLDVFAGSGIFGLMALQLGAAHVDFLDGNPRAHAFARQNALQNGFPSERYRAHLGSLGEFAPTERYDVVLANPPFAPTPPGISGTLNCAGGPEGNTAVERLLARLDRWLQPEGEAFVYVLQLVDQRRPLISTATSQHLPNRTCEFTPVQCDTMPLDTYVAAYHEVYPAQHAAIDRWAAELRGRHDARLGLQHYVLHVQPVRPGPASWHVRHNLAEKYARDMAYPANIHRELARARVLENFVPEAPGDK